MQVHFYYECLDCGNQWGATFDKSELPTMVLHPATEVAPFKVCPFCGTTTKTVEKW